MTNFALHSKQQVLQTKPFSTITMQPLENPCRVLLGLHGNSTERFFLNNLYCLEFKVWSHRTPRVKKRGAVKDKLFPAFISRSSAARRSVWWGRSFTAQFVAVMSLVPAASCIIFQGNTKRKSAIGSMLGHRLRRWPNIDPKSDSCLMFAGFSWHPYLSKYDMLILI